MRSIQAYVLVYVSVYVLRRIRQVGEITNIYIYGPTHDNRKMVVAFSNIHVLSPPPPPSPPKRENSSNDVKGHSFKQNCEPKYLAKDPFFKLPTSQVE